MGQVQALGNLGIPLRGCWSSYVEVVVQRTAGEGSGGLLNTGLACAASRTTVFDVAIGAGWDNRYPDWILAVGWTRLFDRE